LEKWKNLKWFIDNEWKYLVTDLYKNKWIMVGKMKIAKRAIYITTIFFALFIVVLIVASQKDDNTVDVKSENVDYGKLDDIVFSVVTDKAIVGDLIIKISANGKIRADKELEVSSNISGVIDKINIYEGSQVKKDDLLIQLDDREYQLALKEAEDQIMTARVEYGLLKKGLPKDTSSIKMADIYYKNLEELEKSFQNGSISKSEYTKQKDDLDMKIIFTGAKREDFILNKSGVSRSTNTREKAQLNIMHTQIKAKFNGIIGDFNLVEGERINAGETLFKLFDTNQMKIDINILESEISKIKLGNTVEIEIPAIPNEKFYGSVKRISPYIDSEDGTCKVEVAINNNKQKIKPGMFAKVLIETNTLENRLLVKKEALLVRDKRNLVFAVEDSLAKWKYVKLGDENEKYYEILEGVKEGDDIIISGHYNLAHDSKVKVIK